MKNIFNILLLSCLYLFVSCSSTEIEGTTEAETLFNDIKSNYNGKRYLLALEKISSFRSKYPYSFYVTEVELLRANIYYEQENYLEAVDAYLSFRDFHPNYENLDEIEWRISESFFKQLPEGVDRDITPALSAIDSYQDLIRKFPNSNYIEKAKERVVRLEKMLEDKELYIADFYYRTADYQSASYRYRKVLSTSRSDDVIKTSLERAVLSYAKIGNKSECESTLKLYDTFLSEDKRSSLLNACQNTKEVK